ncbi:MAG: hypothetical protein HZB46_11405 [Solirubrobacterales bacterium]|nr:hypothetical protein [Solirubrobacterales bacterium]
MAAGRAAEASEAAGVPLGGPILTYADDTTGVRYEATGRGHARWSVEVSCFHGAEDDDFDAAVHWHHYLAEHVSDDGVAVAGLGDAAIQRDDTLFVLDEPALFYVTVALDGQGPRPDLCAEVARRVIARLAS